jgi:hypothetical protein
VGRRTTSAAILLPLIGAVLAAPAQAKTGEIDHIVITVPGRAKTLTVLGAMLNGQLAQYERFDLYGPLLRGKTRDMERPPDDLGPAYAFTYVFRDVTDDPVRVRETVYLDADPPVAFTPADQTVELYPGDVRPVSSGWRPFPERGANAIEQLMVEAARERPPGGTAEWNIVPPWTLFVVPLLAIGGIMWLIIKLRRRRHATQ